MASIYSEDKEKRGGGVCTGQDEGERRKRRKKEENEERVQFGPRLYNELRASTVKHRKPIDPRKWTWQRSPMDVRTSTITFVLSEPSASANYPFVLAICVHGPGLGFGFWR